ncbi:uncharacterized protein LOC120422570 [Culex pipiens pallens]|uniref:uncharacterized protein LOC120422570 n=1 Tax=Culex pipiens pallens TaxID=42434 RepID=UPI001953B287|nr:uncharacterized protein LOC120422570 [Culex pipiens pallens]
MPPKRTPTKNTPAKEKKVEVDARKEELGALVHLRGKAVEKLNRLKEKLDTLSQPERTVPTVKLNQRKLEMAYSEFSTIHEKVITLVDSAERDPHDDLQLSVETAYDRIFVTLEKWTQELVPVTAGPSNAVVPAVQQPVVIQQLPRILPKFDGKYENWEKFKVIFRDVVDKSNESPRMKLYRLEDALVGEATGSVDAKTIQDGNYDLAWAQLEEKYENKRRMIDLHISGLLKVRKLTQESHTELRSLVESVVSHVENLKFLGQEFSGVSELIVTHLVAQALDGGTRKLLESTIKKGELLKYPETIQFLKDRVSVLERCGTTFDAAPQPSPQQKPRADSIEQPYQIANTAIKSQLGPQCDLCEDTHLTFKCAAFNALRVDQRMEKVREKRVCFNCLRAGHGAKKCRRASSCGKCQRRHHTLLHDFYRKSTAPQRPASAMRQPVETLPPAKVLDSPSPMLQTAVVDLRDDNNRPVPCRILLDCGSQVNFISTSMANRLNLKGVPANVPICGIGGEGINTRESVIVQLQSRYSEFTADVECLVVPRVTGKIPPSPVNVNDWPIPKGFQLADPKFHTPDRIDMLVGASLYFRLLKRGFVYMWDNYPELRETHLGWVVVGGAEGTATTQPLANTAVLEAKKPHQGTALEKASAGISPSPGGGCWSPNV